jgi:hypothetical protein
MHWPERIVPAFAALVACSPYTGETECQGAALAKYVVELRGSGFADYQGSDVYAVTATECRTTSRAVVSSKGDFRIRMSSLFDKNVYPTVAIFVDVDGDGVCDESADRVWSAIGILANPNIEFDVTPADIADPDVDDVDAPDACVWFSGEWW